MVRLLLFVAVALVIIAIAQLLAPRLRAAARGRRGSGIPGGSRAGAYEWDRRRDQAMRKVKRVSVSPEYRDEIQNWLDAREGVEAYVEPKTVMHPLSVVFVDGAGEAKRFELNEDAYLRELARERGLRVLDASRVGYPDRMRRFRSGEP